MLVWVITCRTPRRQVFSWHGWNLQCRWTGEEEFKWATSWQNQQNDVCICPVYSESLLSLQIRPGICPVWSESSLGICPVWSESSLSTWWRKLGSLATHWVHREDSDQTWQMPGLIWVFAGYTGHFVCFVMRWLVEAEEVAQSEITQPVSCGTSRNWEYTKANRTLNVWTLQSQTSYTKCATARQKQRYDLCTQWRLRSAWADAQIRVFSICMKKACVLSYPLSTQRRLWSD